ncbi:MAG TPA: FkbM family methyltransferase [Terriglobia bacterium]|nr:FkbM family methyltransferase [Terriglobia bacterium]
MDLSKAGPLNSLGKLLAQPLSRIACSRFLYTPSRMVEAYLNYVLGNGAGACSLDLEVRAAVTRIRRAQPVVFDVGANIGCWSRSFLRAMPDARVFIFEPSAGCRAVIETAPQLAKATLIPCAVGERPGKATLHFCSATDGTASLHERVDTVVGNRRYTVAEVEVITLDDVIEREKLDFVDLVKMDVEGHEPFVLRGAQRSMAARRIGALAFEFGAGNINSRTFFRDLWDVLTPKFSIWRITPGGRPVFIDEYYEDLEYFRSVSNYIAELREHPFASTSAVPT